MRPDRFITLVAGIALCGLAQPVHAGLNGQQISFRTFRADISRVKITGDNQYGRPVTWDSATRGLVCGAGRCEQVRTEGWWFKGKVVVEYRLQGDRRTYSCHFYVNERQSGNWVGLLAPASDVRVSRFPGRQKSRPQCLTAQADSAD